MLSRSLMMATGRGPQFVSYAAGTNVSSTSLTINRPLSLVSGDMLVAIMGSAQASPGVTWTGAAGWLERLDQGAPPSLRIATLTAGGSEPSSYTFTASVAAVTFGIILCTRNTQWDVLGSIATLSSSGNLTMTGVTSAGGILIAAVASDDGAPVAHSTPAGMQVTTTEIPATNIGGISAFYGNVLAGATGTRTSAISNNSNESSGILLGLKAA